MDARSFAEFLKTVLLKHSKELESFLIAFNYTNNDFLTPKTQSEQNKVFLYLLQNMDKFLEQYMQAGSAIRPTYCTPMDSVVEDDSE